MMGDKKMVEKTKAECIAIANLNVVEEISRKVPFLHSQIQLTLASMIISDLMLVKSGRLYVKMTKEDMENEKNREFRADSDVSEDPAFSELCEIALKNGSPFGDC